MHQCQHRHSSLTKLAAGASVVVGAATGMTNPANGGAPAEKNWKRKVRQLREAGS